MREKWGANLTLKPHKENEIWKLRVCYKHFKESDYTNSSKLHRLNQAAVPFMITIDICETSICETETSTMTHCE